MADPSPWPRPGRRGCFALILALFAGALAGPAAARVSGEPHRLYAEHRLFGGVVVTGNTLMTQSVVAPQVNSTLLANSRGDVRDLPFDAGLEAAYLFWSGSLDGAADRNARLVATDGASQGVAADRCVEVQALGGFFYCRAEVTDFLVDHPGNQRWNGTYTVGDIRASVGELNPDGSCRDRTCQAKYAAWSLVLVYQSDSEGVLRDVFLHDGFRNLDETRDSSGVDRFTIRGFDFPEGGEATVAYFGLEGDAFLGVPPQDTDPIVPCATCFDFMNFAGVRLEDALNPANNLFNSSSPGGFTLGLDLDRFEVGDRLAPGQTEAEIEVGSGDGRVDPDNPEPTGGGESFFLGWVLLEVDRNAPNFSLDGTELAVVPDEAAPLERVVYTLRLSNEGSRDAPNTTIRLALPDGLTYLPGSLRVDGDDPVPGDERANPLAAGLNIGDLPFQGDTDRIITFRATVDDDVAPGSRLSTRATITADTLDAAARTNRAVLVVLGAPPLGEVVKRVIDEDGDGRFVPGERITYQISLTNDGDRPVSGVRVVDNLPPYVDLLGVFSVTGDDVSAPEENRVELLDMQVPPGGVDITVLARIHDEAQLLADGVPPGALDGFAIDNQARAFGGGEIIASAPRAGAAPGPTRLRLSVEIDIAGPDTAKTVSDLNGGRLEPGDALRYVITIANRGAAEARVFVSDPLPPAVESCQLEQVWPELGCNAGLLQGFVAVPAAGRVRVAFTVNVRADAENGAVVRNDAVLRAGEQRVEVRSPALPVVAGPSVATASKVALGAVGGATVPGRTLTWRIEVPNTGNRAIEQLTITDPLGFDYAVVRPADGGVYDPAGNTVTWRLGPIAPGETAVVRVETTLPAAVPDGTEIINQARLAVSNLPGAFVTDDPRTPAEDDPTRVVVRSQPLLVLSKDAAPRLARPGELVTYTLEVRNEGTDEAVDVTVDDPVPAGVFVEVLPEGGRFDGEIVRFTPADSPDLAAIPVGESVTLRVRARLAPVLEDGLAILNTAFADAGLGRSISDDPSTPAPEDATRVVIDSTPSVALSKAVEDLDGGVVQPGDRLLYTLAVSATGDAPALEVIVRDPLPAGLIAVTPLDGGVRVGDTIEWPPIAALVPGEAPRELRFEATVDAALAAGAILANQGQATARGIDATPSDDPRTPAPADPTAVEVVSEPDLSTSIKTAQPREASPGEVVEWRIVVVNSGTAPARAVEVIDPLPLAFLAEVEIDNGGVDDVGGVRWLLDEVPAGGAVALTVRGTLRVPIANGTLISNQARIFADGRGAVRTDDPDTPEPGDATTVRVISAPAPTLTKTVADPNGAPVEPGDVLVYTLIAGNSGTDRLINATLRDALPPELSVLAAPEGIINGDVVDWALPNLDPGQTVERTLRVRVAAALPNGTRAPNQAALTAPDLPQAVLSDDPSTAAPADPTVVQVVSGPNLSGAEKRVVLPDGPRPGAAASYLITVSNTGNDRADPAIVRDRLPVGFTPTEAVGGALVGDLAEWRFPLEPGQSRTVRVDGVLDFPLADGAVIANQATVSAGDASWASDDPDTPELDDPTAITVEASADIQLSKEAFGPNGGAAGRPGQPVRFVLTALNRGDADAVDIEITDALPGGVIGPFAVDRDDAVIDGRTIRWRPTVAAQGSPERLIIDARLAAAVPDGATIVNVARLGDLSARAELPVIDGADLRLSKTVETEARIGDRVVYTLTLRNAGSAAAEQVVVTDPLPPELTFIGAAPPAQFEEPGRVEWTLGDLPRGAETVLRIEAQIADAADGAPISNQASVSAVGIEALLSDDPSTDEPFDDTRFDAVAAARLVLDKTLLTPVPIGGLPPGAAVEYSLELRNDGAGASSAIDVVDVLDEAFDPASIIAVGGETDEATARWRVEPIPAGERVVLRVRARLSEQLRDGRIVSNAFTATPANAAPLESEAVELRVGTGGLRLQKSVEPLEPAGFSPGAEVQYTLRVANTRDVAVSEVSISDLLDLSRLTDINPLDGGLFNPATGRIDWSPDLTDALRLIAAGGVAQVTLRARIRADVEVGETVANAAVARVGGDREEARSEVEFAVRGAPRLAVTKRIRPGSTAPGAIVRYEIIVTNESELTANRVTLTDELPAAVRYQPGTTTRNGAPIGDVGGQPPFANGSALAVGSSGRLRPGETETIAFEVRVDPATPAGTLVRNTAEVNLANGDAVFGENAFVVGGQPDLSGFLKTARVIDGAEPGRALVGETIEWTLSLSNTGGQAAFDVLVEDPLGRGHEYVRGSLALDGQTLSDGPDRDAGQVLDERVVLVTVDRVPSGATRRITFRTEVTQGPTVLNQAFATMPGAAEEPSDDGGADENDPTVVPVDEAPRRTIRVEKVADRAPGEAAFTGEAVRFTLQLRNTGTVDLSALEVIDTLPAGLLFEGVESLPTGARVEVESPGGALGEIVRISPVDLPVGESTTFVVLTRVDPGLTADTELCNEVVFQGAGATPDGDEACVEVEARSGRLSGVVFEDADGDGALDFTRDRLFADMLIALSRMDDPDGPPVAEATTDADGAWRLGDMPPGGYRARIYTSSGVLMATRDDVVVSPDQETQVALAIDPSGRVYDSATGELIDGAEVFIYRDLDTDDDPFDAESVARRLLVPPEELEAPSQQGQRTANGGLYRFAVRAPGRYIMEVVPPGLGRVSPSVLVPPVPGLAFTDDPGGRIVPEPLPSVAPDADRTYFLAFDLGPDDFYQHNHIPLDPLASLIDVTKRVRRPTASVGEIVSFEIDIVNRSPRDLVYDPVSDTGGVVLQDVLPRGLKYVNRTATLVRVRGGEEIPLSADDPEGIRILRFDRLIDLPGVGLVRRPLDLNAGEALRLRYHTVVGADTRPRRILRNRAQLLADGNIPVSRVAEAAVRIVADPDFDQGMLLGRVWCDEDGDGRQTTPERGLAGVRVMLDSGYLAISDRDGQFHFQDIDPGTHAVKIDRGSLLPGAELTTDEVRVIHFTRGMPAKIGFGVTCPAERTEGARLELAEAGLIAALTGLRDRYAVITGNVEAMRVVYGTQLFEAPPIAVELLVDGEPAQSPDLPASGEGVAATLAFRTGLSPEAPRSRWSLRIGPFGGALRAVAGGEGAPPAVIGWDQRGPDGKPLLAPGSAYVYRLEVGRRDGAVFTSAAGVFGVGVTAPPPPESIARFSADDFTDDGAPNPALADALQALVPQLIAEPGPLLIEVHNDDSLGPITARSRTRRKAEAVLDFLVERGLDASKLQAEGLGGSRPIWPNITDRNRRRNRRVVILRGRATPDSPQELPLSTFERAVRVDRRAIEADKAGDFALTATVPPEGIVEVLLQADDGRRAMFPIRVRPGRPVAPAVPRPVLVEGKLPDRLTVGGRPVKLPLSPPRVAGPAAVSASMQFTFEAKAQVDGWRFVVVGPNDQPVQRAEGVGPPPDTFEWAPDGPLTDGRYSYQLTVRSGATVAQSAPGALTVGAASPLVRPVGGWRLQVDGRPAEADAQGRIYAPRSVVADAPLMLDAIGPDGSRVLFFVTPPSDAASGEAPARDRRAATPAAVAEDAIGAPAAVGGGGVGLTPRPDAAPSGLAQRPAALPKRPPVPIRQSLTESARAPMVDFGQRELLQVLAPIVSGDDADVPARTLAVELPPAGAELSGLSVPIRGTTAPGNRIFLNGVEAHVDRAGRFAGAVDLKPGSGHIEVSSVDPQGNRGVIRRPVVAPDSGWFLLALGEGLMGQLQSALNGVEPPTRLGINDQIYLHGRAVGWFRGYAKGDEILGGLIEQYRAEVHIDTARRADFESAFRSIVDPDRFYPVYGDRADLSKPVNTRGPLYVLLEADRNSARIGNFTTDLQGVELFRYDRTLYGAAVEIDQRTGDFRHQLTGFAADGDLAQRHAYVELRGTGGSLYYLPHRSLVEGSERLYMVERDRVSGTERRRTLLARDTQYSIRYDDGRILLREPLPSVTLDAFGAREQPDQGEVLDGHPVYLAVEYDHEDPFADGEAALGVRARESYGEAVSVGAGYVQEGRPDGLPDYKLWGADLRLKHGRRTGLEAEFARSQSVDAESVRSEDGGLSFRPFNGRDGTRARGSSMLIRGAFELDDVIGEGDRELWHTEGYWQYIAPGFYSGGSIQQQGLEKYGAASRYVLDGGHRLHVRHDGVVAEDPLSQGEGLFAAYRRDVTRAGYGFRAEQLSLDAELVHTVYDPGEDPDRVVDTVAGGAPLVTDAASLSAQYALDERWTLLLEQEVVLVSDDRVHQEPLDLFTSSFGLRYQLDDDLQIEALESVRWTGDNATRIGLRTALDDRRDLYVQERFERRDGQSTNTAVVGGEERFGEDQSGRVYGEYQLDTGMIGARNRAVIGIGKRFEIIDKLTLDAGYERSQVFGDAAVAGFSRDAVTLGVKWLDEGRVEVVTRYELRYDDNADDAAVRDRMQLLALNRARIGLGRDVTLQLRLNYSSTYDLVFEASEAELLEAGLGLAWRPVEHDWLAVIARYTKRYEQRPIDVAIERPDREETDVLSLVPIIELPWGFQVVEKLVYRRTAVTAANLPTIASDTVLWINRINYHVTETWDAGVEYRMLSNDLSRTMEHGALLELNYILQKRIRLGAGYNFTSFSDEEFASLDEDFGGPFFRVTAHY